MGKASSNGHGPKSYSKFSLKDLSNLGLDLRSASLFTNISPVQPSAWLQEALSLDDADILTGSEKGKSEFIIAPVIRELTRRNAGKMTVFPGYLFDVDAEKGLAGYCDFIFSRAQRALLITAPVFFLVEAKSDNLENGTAQCIAEMYAAQLFNQQAGNPIATIYGVVTWGQQWRFYALTGDTAYQDTTIYGLSELPELLGVLQYIVDQTNATTP